MRKTLTVLLFIFYVLICNAMQLPRNFSEQTIISKSDALPLSVLIAKPQSPAKAIVQIVHGMCEHKERYFDFISFLNKQGYLVIIHDHRGHGKSILSDNDLGYFYQDGYVAMIDDAQMISHRIKKQYPDLNLYLLGHSMGSMIVRSMVKQNDSLYNGLIVCGSPSYSIGSKAGARIAKRTTKKKGDRYRSHKIQSLTFAGYTKNIPNPQSANAWICTDNNIVKAYDTDPFCNFIFTANGFQNLYELMGYTYSRKDWKMENTNLPIWFISGADDPCMISKRKFEKAVNTMKKVGYNNVSSTIYPNMRHEILNEIEKQKVWTDIIEQLSTW